MTKHLRLLCAGAQDNCLASIAVPLHFFADINQLQRVIGPVGFTVIERVNGCGGERPTPDFIIACEACTAGFLEPESRREFEQKLEMRRAGMS